MDKPGKAFSDKTTVPFDLPVEHDGTKYDSLTIRRARARDQLAADAGGGTDAQKEARLFANLCEVSPDVIGLLDLGDYRRLQRAFLDFLS